jgi:hypothetical protein
MNKIDCSWAIDREFLNRLPRYAGTAVGMWVSIYIHCVITSPELYFPQGTWPFGWILEDIYKPSFTHVKM